ncbi:hypothetical protein ACFYVL_27100 [Streptomyces sp. NPDC004111]|uniref:hypothetical protein n=1 Tax=Streptomyces sp. NPDC004111 TaxID=3364690 RepID=UPI0036A57E9D
MAVAALLVALAACEAGADAPARKTASPKPTGPHALFKRPLRDQVHAAGRATKEVGNAHFRSTLRYGSARGDIVLTEEGDQDYLTDSAVARTTFRMPAAHPRGLLDDIGEESRTSEKNFAVVDSDVYYRTASGRWLRYSRGMSQEFSENASHMLNRNADAAPYSVPLTGIIAAMAPRRAPQVRPDGIRRYTAPLTPADIQALLPEQLDKLLPDRARDGLTAPLTVDIDAQGRLRKATAQLDGVLAVLKKHRSSYRGLTTLRAEYTLSGFGRSSPKGLPGGSGVDDAEKVLVALKSARPGACGTTDTGLSGISLMRPVDCAKPHDVRVFAHVSFDENVPGATYDKAMDMALEACDGKYGSMPRAWRSSNGDFWAHEDAYDLWIGSGESQLVADYTCFTRTS